MSDLEGCFLVEFVVGLVRFQILKRRASPLWTLQKAEGGRKVIPKVSKNGFYKKNLVKHWRDINLVMLTFHHFMECSVAGIHGVGPDGQLDVVHCVVM